MPNLCAVMLRSLIQGRESAATTEQSGGEGFTEFFSRAALGTPRTDQQDTALSQVCTASGAPPPALTENPQNGIDKDVVVVNPRQAIAQEELCLLIAQLLGQEDNDGFLCALAERLATLQGGKELSIPPDIDSLETIAAQLADVEPDDEAAPALAPLLLLYGITPAPDLLQNTDHNQSTDHNTASNALTLTAETPQHHSADIIAETAPASANANEIPATKSETPHMSEQGTQRDRANDLPWDSTRPRVQPIRLLRYGAPVARPLDNAVVGDAGAPQMTETANTATAEPMPAYSHPVATETLSRKQDVSQAVTDIVPDMSDTTQSAAGTQSKPAAETAAVHTAQIDANMVTALRTETIEAESTVLSEGNTQDNVTPMQTTKPAAVQHTEQNADQTAYTDARPTQNITRDTAVTQAVGNETASPREAAAPRNIQNPPPAQTVSPETETQSPQAPSPKAETQAAQNTQSAQTVQGTLSANTLPAPLAQPEQEAKPAAVQSSGPQTQTEGLQPSAGRETQTTPDMSGETMEQSTGQRQDSLPEIQKDAGKDPVPESETKTFPAAHSEEADSEQTAEKSRNSETNAKSVSQHTDYRPQGTQAFNQTAETQESPLRQVMTKNVMDQIVHSAALKEAKGGMKLEIELNPKLLGKISLELVSQNGELRAKLRAESDTVKGLLASHLDSLREQMKEAGINMRHIEVETGKANAEPDGARQDFRGQWQGRQFRGDGQDNDDRRNQQASLRPSLRTVSTAAKETTALGVEGTLYRRGRVAAAYGDQETGYDYRA